MNLPKFFISMKDFSNEPMVKNVNGGGNPYLEENSG